jgi:pyruvate,water dikinase
MKEPVLAQFLGDDTFPIDWKSESEKSLFWVYDDLHCPHPLSPLYYDTGGWWASCDNMFRRFGYPLAADWIAKQVNGYLYTAVVPQDPDFMVDAEEWGARYAARVPLDRDYAAKIGTYLDKVLPVYGEEFANWWTDRLVPEMKNNYAYIEGELAKADHKSLMELAVLMEDMLDIYDRHWKIHWMLNFGQLAATLNLRAVAAKVHGSIDEVLLGRLQNSPDDRNWDSIRAIWEMKQEVKADEVLANCFKGETANEILAALDTSARGRQFLHDRVLPYQQEFGWHSVWSHEVYFPTVVESPEPVIELVRSYIENDYDFPKTIEHVRADLKAASEEILAGLEGESLEEMRHANRINLLNAPLTPNHHFYIDQGTNAHVRLIAIAIGKKLVELGALEQADDVVMLTWYNELRVLAADQKAFDARALVKARRAEREVSYKFRPPAWIGTATKTQIEFPYLNLWGFPDRFYKKASTVAGTIAGLGGAPGVVEGTARVVVSLDQFDDVQQGDILVCQMTNPAWALLFTRISGVVTDGGGTVSHACVLSREFSIPCVVGAGVATKQIKSGDRVRVDGTSGVVEILS